MTRKQRALFEPALVRTALIDAVKKLDPRVQWRNPVMFVVYIGSLLTTAIWLAILTGQTDGAAAFTGSVALWLWFTVLFANFAEALAEGRSKAQAESLKGTKKTSWAKKLAGPRRTAPRRKWLPRACAKAISCWWKPATPFRATAKCWRAAPRWMKAPSPGNPPR